MDNRLGSPGNFPVALFQEVKVAEEKESENGWVSRTLSQPATDGKRNDVLASLAGYFALTNVGPKVACDILQLWDSRNVPPLGEEVISRSVKSVYKTAKKRAISTGPPLPEGEEMFNLMDFGKYMSTYYGQEHRWLIDEWLPDSSITFVVSPPGTGKTWMLLDLAVSVASGALFLGRHKPTDTGPVILIQQEDFHGQTVERLSLIAHARLGMTVDGDSLELPPKIPIFIHPDRKLKFDDQKIMDSLAKQCEKYKPKLVILDPLYSAADTDDYMASTAEQMFALKAIRDKVGTGFVIAHHTKKGQTENGREAAWGSQFLNAFLETGWQLRPNADATVRVKRHFKQFANPKEIDLKFDIDTEDDFLYRVTEQDIKEKKKKEPTGEDIKKEAEPVSGNKLKAALIETLRVSNKALTINDLAKAIPGSDPGEIKLLLKPMAETLNSGVTQFYHRYKYKEPT